MHDVKTWCTINCCDNAHLKNVTANFHCTLLRYIASNEWLFDVIFNKFAMNVMDYSSQLLMSEIKKISNTGVPLTHDELWKYRKNNCVYNVFDEVKYLLVYPIIPWLDLSKEYQSNFLHKFIGKYGMWMPKMYEWRKPSNRMDMINEFVVQYAVDIYSEGGFYTLNSFNDGSLKKDYLKKRRTLRDENGVLSHKKLKRIYKRGIKCGNVMCNKWNENNDFKLCKGCKIVSYCSSKCQKYDWNRFKHKRICSLIQKGL